MSSEHITRMKIFALEHYEITEIVLVNCKLPKIALKNCEIPQYYNITYENQTLKVLLSKKIT